MKIQFIGTGGAFASLSRGQSNMLFISDSGKKLLLDCGMTAPYKLQELGISAQDLDGVYISHLHADHIGGMEWLGFMTYFNPSAKKPLLFCERNLMNELWEQSLRGGMRCLQGIDADLHTYFNCHPIDMQNSGLFEWEGYIFRLVQTLHVVGGYSFNNSYGLMIYSVDNTEHKTFITTDTQFTYPCPLQGFYDKATVIFHDCETSKFKSGVHAHYDDMNNFLNDDTKKKMYLYHHGEKRDTVETDGFAGFVTTGQVFDLNTNE